MKTLVLSALVFLSATGCHTAKQAQKTFDQGYRTGSGDAVKRQYWIKQQLERAASDSARTRTVTVTLSGIAKTEDGRVLTDTTESLEVER